MKRLALLLTVLTACTTPEERAERDLREARNTPDVRRRLELLDQAIERHPTVEAHLERALLSETARDPERAVADLTAAIRFVGDHPAHASLYLSRGLLYGKLKRFEEADADLSEAVRATGSPEAYLERAWFRRKAGKGAEAELDLVEARKQGAGLADPFYNEGVRLISRGDTDEAERMFQFALDLDPFHSRSHVAMARIYMERRRFAEAAAALDRAIPARPNDPELYYHRGNARLAAGRGEDAIADYSKAATLAPAEPVYLVSRGTAQIRVRQDAGKALEDFAQAIRIDPRCWTAYYQRGLLRHERHELEEAEQDLLRATSIRASPEGCLALGRVLHDRGEYDKALSLYAQALEIYKEPDVQKTLAAEVERTRRAKESQK